jgi:hypothetical protein
MGQTPEQIRKQMEKLEAKLAKAEAAEREKVEKKILRAATRSGLVNTQLSTAELTEKFAKILEEERGESSPEMALKPSPNSATLNQEDEPNRTQNIDQNTPKPNSSFGPSL